MKLVQHVAQLAGVSRRQATALIKSGLVKLNDEITFAYSQECDPTQDKIEVQGVQPKVSLVNSYFAYHKPRGIECTLADKPNSLLGVVRKIGMPNLKPVGRLDLDSEGLLILTNDGNLIQALTHPKHKLIKTYAVWVTGLKSPAQLDALRLKLTIPEVQELKPGRACLQVLLPEGQNRQIRRACAGAGLYVERILRTAIGTVQLGKLKAGEWKSLNIHEYANKHTSLGESFFS